MNYLEKMKENNRKERSHRNKESAKYKVHEIVKGALGENNRQFETGAELINLIGEGDTKNNHVNGLKNRYSKNSGSISFGKEGKLSELKSEGLIEEENIDGQKVSKLTELGEEVYQRIKPLFQGVYESEELERAVQEFKDIYLRDPTVDELNLFLDIEVTENKLKSLGGWMSPSEDLRNDKTEDVLKHISGALVTLHSSKFAERVVKKRINRKKYYEVKLSDKSTNKEFLDYITQLDKISDCLDYDEQADLRLAEDFVFEFELKEDLFRILERDRLRILLSNEDAGRELLERILGEDRF